jgi:hypothetical protein
MAIFNSYVKLPEGSHLECDSSKNFRRMPLPSMLWWEKQHLITATQCLHLNPLLGCQVNQGTKQEWHCAFARLLNVNLISRAPKKHHKYDPVQHHTASIMDTSDTSDTSDISPGCFFARKWPMKPGRGVTIKPQAGLGPQGRSSAWASFGWVNS